MSTTTVAGPSGPVVYNIYVNGVLYNNQPPVLDVQLVQEYGMHDMLYIRIEWPVTATQTLSNQSLWPPDTPVQVQWGRVPDVNVWYGYINHHEVNSSADSGTNMMQITYVCVGTSIVLNVALTRKWEQVSPTYIAKQIAAENGFRAITTPINYPLTYEVQVGESDFQFLNRIADKTGLRFWCSGGTLYMISPTAALEGSGQNAIPVYSLNKSLVTLDTCRDFQYMQGNNLPGSVQANRAIFGIDASSGRLFSATATPVNSTSRIAVKTSYAAQSYIEAANRIQAWAALAQFWIGATCTLYGNTTLYPGKLVRITGAALPDNAAGYWLISEASHGMSQSSTALTTLDKYLTDVVLLRNQKETNTVVLSNVTPVNPELTSMTLNTSGHWISTDLAAVSIQ